jgi:HAMP domain-containing protein
MPPTPLAPPVSHPPDERSRSARTAVLYGIALLAIGGVTYERHVSSSRRAARAAETLSASVARGDPILRVPHATGAITLDGDTDDPGWLRPPGPARTGDYVFKNGKPARPYSETRIVWSGDYLYLALYASDEDIQSHTEQPDEPNGLDDVFRIVFSDSNAEYAIEVSPRAVITDSIRRDGGDWDLGWSSGAHASREIDGTINDPKNTDEEWAIELAVPFESLGMRGEPGENIGMSLSRCDTPKRGTRVCAGWGDGPVDRGRGRIVLE